MSDAPTLRRIGVPTAFDEARAEIARWEAEYPNALQIAMIVREPDGFEYSITGETILTEAAGIFFRAAQLAAE